MKRLTEQMLPELGFINFGLEFSNCNIYENGDMRVMVNKTHKDFAFTFKRISPPSLSLIHVEYVHELQSIVKALKKDSFLDFIQTTGLSEADKNLIKGVFYGWISKTP